ncbi:MAG TPA: rhodanese-like domain-containing protein [Pyrinomonadaceae bacterium]|jgi:rhodanese-related sulfurtransferase
MKLKRWECLSLLLVAMLTIVVGQTQAQTPRSVEFMSVDELKAKLEKRETVTVIDVRSISDLANSENKIKGAIHVKLRRLKSRLTLPPLKDVSRDSEVVLYCACPNDEASIRGAEILLESGFKRVHALKGGWVAWKRSGGQTESRPRG